jgi:hypothetical protein
MHVVTTRITARTIPLAGPERVEALEALAAELVRVLGPVAARYLASLVDEAVAEQEEQSRDGR